MQKETEDNIKKGTLKVDQHTDVMPVVRLCKRNRKWSDIQVF